MGEFSNLTEEQSRLLVSIAKLATRSESEPLFGVASFGTGLVRVLPIGMTDRLGQVETEWLGVHSSLDYLHHAGFLHFGEGGRRSFVLCQKALDYYKWVGLPKWRQRLAELSKAWATDLRTGVIAIVVSLVSSLVINLLFP